MIRVVPCTINGAEFELATMSWKEAEAYSTSGAELLKKLRENPEDQEAVSTEVWKARMFGALVASLNKAQKTKNGDAAEFTREQLEENYDKPTLEELYTKLLKASGLMGSADVGGVPAA